MPDGQAFRALPRVDDLVSRLEQSGLPHELVLATARSALDLARADISAGRPASDVDETARDLLSGLARRRSHRVVNATGVLLHTNLGRAPLSPAAAEAAAQAGSGYTNLELDLSTGERGGRGQYVQALLELLTGAEDALIVNNNAAAVLLALTTLARGEAVAVSRGELIEIGGSYRLPRVMEAGGVNLVEVGTTNRTRVDDYRTALQVDRCAAVLRVHPSNYRIEGFTERPGLEELADLTRGASIPLIYDVGSGLLDAETPWLGKTPPSWLTGEPGVRQALLAGADLVTFSGDKLLGGPQSGIVAGRSDLVERLRRHPVSRALRVDAMTDAALAATLEAYADDRAGDVPFWRMASTGYGELEDRARALAQRLQAKIVEGSSVVGAGSVPGSEIPTPLLLLEGEDHLHRRLLDWDPPILARRREKDLVVDLRTVDREHDSSIASAVESCR